MSAIDPSLLFYQNQQQSNQGHGQGRSNYGGPVNGQEQGQGMQQDEEEEKKPAMQDEDMGVGGSANCQDSEPEANESAPMDLKDDATLAAFLAKMDEYEPILPDAVTRYYLERAGFQASDDRVTRLLGLAAQKFVSDIATDAYAYARTRTMAGPGRAPGTGNASVQTGSSKQKDRTRTTLTMDDLAAAMNEYGIDATRQVVPMQSYFSNTIR